jgi:hypothetical protein
MKPFVTTTLALHVVLLAAAAVVPSYAQDFQPVATNKRQITLQTDSDMHVDVHNTFPTVVHLAEKSQVGGFWQEQVTNFGPSSVAVDGGTRLINGKKDPVIVPGGCQAYFLRDGSNYAWDPSSNS